MSWWEEWKSGTWRLSHNSTDSHSLWLHSPMSTVRAPVFGKHQFFGTSEHCGKTHGSLLSGWMNYNYTACCWFPTSSNILILPSQFWKIRYESCCLHCSKCRILDGAFTVPVFPTHLTYFMSTVLRRMVDILTFMNLVMVNLYLAFLRVLLIWK